MNGSIDIDECCSLPSTIRIQQTAASDDHPKNRYAVASRAFQAGAVVLRNAPLSCSLINQSKDDEDRQYCAYCFAKGATEVKLSRCGRCKSIWYCSRGCQKLDFQVHKVECAYFTSSSFRSFDNNNNMQTDRVVAEICLLIRTFVLVTKSSGTVKENVGMVDRIQDSPCTPRKHDAAVDCGIIHLFALQKSSLSMDSVDQLMVTEATNAIWAKRSQLYGKGNDGRTQESIRHAMEILLRIFRVNNFGITNELLQVVANAVYPLGALLNHSCQPNCLLRYHFGSKTLPILEIVACRDIKQGEELTHSYVELVQPIKARQDRLRSNYGFTCECDRCLLEKGEQAPEDLFLLLQLQERGLIRQWLDYFDPNTTLTTLPDLHRRPARATEKPVLDDSKFVLRRKIDQYRRQAIQCMTMDNLKGELDCLSNAVKLLCQLLVHQKEKDESIAAKEVNLEMYEVRGELLGVQIVAGQTEQAIVTCECMVVFLASTLCGPNARCYNHPILGLQLFTLGDLYQTMAAESTDSSPMYQELAKKTFSWAHKILSVSHGEQSNMILLLRDKMSI